jgi:uncharacterized glyoxalase superfamily protein PhnB
VPVEPESWDRRKGLSTDPPDELRTLAEFDARKTGKSHFRHSKGRLPMKLRKVVPMMTVPDVERAIEFYRGVLAFEVVNQMEGWALLQNHGVELMFALPNAHEPFDRPHFTGSLYFTPQDVDALWEKLKDKADIFYPIENFFYGMREFAIRDNNGYILQFGQEIRDGEELASTSPG